MQAVLQTSPVRTIQCAHIACSRSIGTRTAVLKDGRIYCGLECASAASRSSLGIKIPPRRSRLV